MNRGWLFMRLTRPHFLVGGALLYAAGAAQVGIASVGVYLLGQAMVTAVQLTAQLANEYADSEADKAVTNRTLFSGGSGVLSDSLLPRRTALQAARTTSALAVVLAMLVVRVSVDAAVIGAIALFVSWAYSMPPIRLLDTGWGEVATSVVVAVFVPITGSLINGGAVTGALLWITALLFVIHMAMLLAFELPDIDSDRDVGKSVLAVRMGSELTRRAILGLFVAGAGIAIIGPVDYSGWMLVAVIPAASTVAASERSRFGLLTASAVATLVTVCVGAIVTA